MQVIPNILFSQDKIKAPQIDNQFFIENNGQWDSEVLFLTKQNGMNAWITKHGVVYDFYKIIDNSVNADKFTQTKGLKQRSNIKESQIVTVDFINPSKNLTLQPEGKNQCYYNYFIGND